MEKTLWWLWQRDSIVAVAKEILPWLWQTAGFGRQSIVFVTIKITSKTVPLKI